MGSPGNVRPNAAPTLSFRLGSLPVRIHPWFLVLGLLLGLGPQRGVLGIAARALAFLCVVFAHELAHAGAARSFGVPAEVDLTLFRGALGPRIAALSPRQRLVVSLAGPGVNLCIATLVFAVIRTHPPARDIAAGAFGYLGWINLGWGLLNLLPILPLDGGHALGAILDPSTNGRGEHAVRIVSIVSAMALGCALLIARALLPALTCGLLAFQNFRALGVAREQRNREAVARVHLRAAFDALERGAPPVAIRHCQTILGSSTDPALRKDAVRLLAYAYATSNDWERLMDVLESGGAQMLEAGDLEKYQRAAGELGRAEDARRIEFLRTHFA